MMKLNTNASSISKEASELNKLSIKIKREILKGNITTITSAEVDEATIPALTVLRNMPSSRR
ncbi:MAG TPA: hypothetical protein VEZ55_07705 [Chitinophagaceae bacterium]|nr:hypothetical protein [Chitinophagaceae bacterium]